MTLNYQSVTQGMYNWYRNIIRNPKYRWWVILGTLAYLLSPIDIAPDFIPIIGQIDDVVIMTLLVSEISQLLIDRVKAQEVKPSETSDAPINSEPVDVKAVQID